MSNFIESFWPQEEDSLGRSRLELDGSALSLNEFGSMNQIDDHTVDKFKQATVLPVISVGEHIKKDLMLHFGVCRADMKWLLMIFTVLLLALDTANAKEEVYFVCTAVSSSELPARVGSSSTPLSVKTLEPQKKVVKGGGDQSKQWFIQLMAGSNRGALDKVKQAVPGSFIVRLPHKPEFQAVRLGGFSEEREARERLKVLQETFGQAFLTIH